jgi:hypothetical protein
MTTTPTFDDTRIHFEPSPLEIDVLVRYWRQRASDTVLRHGSYSPASINRTRAVLEKILHDAVDREIIVTFPIRGKLPKEKEPIFPKKRNEGWPKPPALLTPSRLGTNRSNQSHDRSESSRCGKKSLK